MLYLAIKWLMRITVEFFFKTVQITNKEAIPKKAPLLILANHPSMLMDPVVVASILNRKVFFLAKGVLFNGKFAQWFLPKLGIIPVHRVQDDPTQLARNASTFKKCFEHLEKGEAILMFPEGISNRQRKLQPLKTGAAKIALGTESRNNNQLGLQILIIGLHYDDQHKFNRDLLVHIQDTIDVPAFIKSQNGDVGNKSAEILTELIRKKLEEVVVSIEDENNDKLVKIIEDIYKDDLLEESTSNLTIQEKGFLITQKIGKAVNYYAEQSPERVEKLRNNIQAYKDKLDILKLDDKEVRDQHNLQFSLRHFWNIIHLVVGFPLYVYGLINNIIPFQIPDYAGDMSKDKDMKGSIGMVVGGFTFFIFYTIQIICMQVFMHSIILTILYGISLPLSGFFAYYYWYSLIRFRTRWNLYNKFRSKRDTITSLINSRAEIVNELNELKTGFLAAQVN